MDLLEKRLKPYSDGVYIYDLVLTDSLKLVLDKNYRIYFFNRRNKIVASSSFRYEDYELHDSSVEAFFDQPVYYKGDSIRVKVKAADSNGLPLADASVKVSLLFKSVVEMLTSRSSFPETLDVQTQSTAGKEELEFVFPPSVASGDNIEFSARVDVTLADGKKVEKRLNATRFYNEKQDVQFALSKDSLCMTIQFNGKDTTDRVSIYGVGVFGNSDLLADTTLPCTLKVDPMYARYRVVASDAVNTYTFDKSSCLSSVRWNASGDTLFPEVINGLHLPMHCYLTVDGELFYSGDESGLPEYLPWNVEKSYCLEASLLWAGRVIQLGDSVGARNKRQLYVSVEQPFVIVPGQTCEMEVSVTDCKGKPVKKADVTAYAISDLFRNVSHCLNYSSVHKNKTHVSYYDPTVSSLRSKCKYMCLKYDNLESWKKLDRIDTLPYYQLLYPGDSLRSYSYYTEDSITQITPILCREGSLLPITVVYIDDVPCHILSKTTFSFPITPNEYHQLRLRTDCREYTIDSVRVEPYRRTLLSFDKYLVKDPRVKIEKKGKELSADELSRLKPYIILFDGNISEGSIPLTIEHDGGIATLEYKYYDRTCSYAGPILGDVRLTSKKFDVTLRPDTNVAYSYDVIEGKLLSRPVSDSVYNELFQQYWGPGERILTDEYLTKERRQRLEQELSKASASSAPQKYSYLCNYPYSPTANSMLVVSTSKPVFRYVLIPYGDELADPSVVAPSFDSLTKKFEDIEEDLYRIYLLNSDTTCYRIDSVQVKTGQVSMVVYDPQKDSVMLDTFALQLMEFLDYQTTNDERSSKKSLLYRFFQKYDVIPYVSKNDTLTDVDRSRSWLLRGRVSDSDGALPYTEVRIVGSSEEVSTDMDGMYEIIVHSGDILEFSFMGYETERFKITPSSSKVLNVTMKEYSLNEIVQVGYGVQRRSDLTGSIASVFSSVDQALAGRVAGVQVSAASGQPGATVRIHGVSSLSGSSDPLYVIDGVPVGSGSSSSSEPLSSINPSDILSMEVLKDESATAIYGSRAANGVILITTRKGGKSSAMEHEVVLRGNLRTNFSDCAFWQPTLRTDKEGKSRFSVTFPDDITRWHTICLADAPKRSYVRWGSCESSIKSFVPLSTRLYLPEFVVDGDSCYIRGKVSNYLQDTAKVTSSFSVDDSLLASFPHDVVKTVNDTFLLRASLSEASSGTSDDSLSVTYKFVSDNHFMDGEKRDVKVLPQGVKCTEGSFGVLYDTLQLSLQSDKSDSVTIRLMDSQFDLLQDEVRMLTKYPYGCNEQTTSKLIGFKTAMEDPNLKRHQKNVYQKKIDGFVQTLKDRQLKNGFWGWWWSGGSKWITRYIVETLQMYQVDFPKEGLLRRCEVMRQDSSFSDKVFALNMLRLLDADVDYKKQVAELDSLQSLQKVSGRDRLDLLELKSNCGMPIDYDWLNKYRKETMLGGVFYRFNGDHSVDRNERMNTLLVYRIMQADTLQDHSEEMRKMRAYFYEQKSNSSTLHWFNTYESAMIVRTLSDDVEKDGEKKKTIVRLSGSVNEEVDQFPYEKKVPASGEITMRKESSEPLFVSTFADYWDRPVEAGGKDFSIETSFADSVLKLGENVKMSVVVTVEKDASYVLINVPIPAGCSYANKENSLKNHEVYREHFKDHVNIFCSELKRGAYEFTIELLPRFKGTYILNPAKVEQMYQPEFNAYNAIQRVKIQ